ncbi:aminopeptidase PepB [Aliikangiella sp. IMCC44359]|uniref:aminopeptidase PepB n=1 Tax=Aliikangiella sp. IMCC44359 TaxID=3459125 RepID=UPI00403B0224
MKQSFQVLLSSSKIDNIWGENSSLSFDETGATIHIESFVDNLSSMEKIQKAARSIAQMKVPEVTLVGEWPLEAQWHFWQGSFEPKKSLNINFAELPVDETQTLESRVKVHTWVRQIINQTPEELSPIGLATEAGDFISQLAPDLINYKIISGKELEEKGYVGIFGVGRGSTRPPALLELDFCPKGHSNKSPAAALVGKGITFDSGGYSLKSSVGMLHMKSDMGGAATVAGALALAITSGLNQRVKLYLCCAENLVSGHAYKLADILKYRNGVSVEVVNTDAEGRLVLADGLIDASESGAPIIIDAATLTGAAMVAVGSDYNALFSMDDELAAQFISIAESEKDLAWRLPLTANHRNNCPSAYADTANSRPMPGGGSGAASNAAGFLSRFVSTPETGWLHVDLAACFKDSGDSLWSAGATGRGVRSIAAFLNQL